MKAAWNSGVPRKTPSPFPSWLINREGSLNTILLAFFLPSGCSSADNGSNHTCNPSTFHAKEVAQRRWTFKTVITCIFFFLLPSMFSNFLPCAEKDRKQPPKCKALL